LSSTSIPLLTVNTIPTSSPPGNNININYVNADLLPPTITRRIDLLCTLKITDQFVTTPTVPLASQWNYYSNSPTSTCKNLTDYAAVTEVTPAPLVFIKKYVLNITTNDLVTGNPAFANNPTTPSVPSICLPPSSGGGFYRPCRGVAPFTSPANMRVSPSQLAGGVVGGVNVPPIGPTAVTGAMNKYTATYGFLVYNLGPSPAFSVVIDDIVGAGSSSGTTITAIPSTFQANFADSGAVAPGTFSYNNGVLQWVASPGTFIPAGNGINPNPPSADSPYNSTAAIFITFDATVDSLGPNCVVRDVVNLRNYSAIEGGINLG